MKKKYYHKPGSVATFWSKNYIKYESKSDNNNSNRKKTLSVGEYLNKITPYLKDIINNLKRPDTWKT